MNLHTKSSSLGQDVGRSCILVTIGGKNIMLDCGKKKTSIRLLDSR